jgi:hypothetical protein
MRHRGSWALPVGHGAGRKKLKNLSEETATWHDVLFGDVSRLVAGGLVQRACMPFRSFHASASGSVRRCQQTKNAAFLPLVGRFVASR